MSTSNISHLSGTEHNTALTLVEDIRAQMAASRAALRSDPAFSELLAAVMAEVLEAEQGDEESAIFIPFDESTDQESVVQACIIIGYVLARFGDIGKGPAN